MLRLIKHLFIALLSFRWSLATKYAPLNSEPCMNRPLLVDLNPVELSYYRFKVSLDTGSGSCNAAVDLSTKICVPSKTKKHNG